MSLLVKVCAPIFLRGARDEASSLCMLSTYYPIELSWPLPALIGSAKDTKLLNYLNSIQVLQVTEEWL